MLFSNMVKMNSYIQNLSFLRNDVDPDPIISYSFFLLLNRKFWKRGKTDANNLNN
jgi:hypothetical protein